jgi:drug/metabolite transporter (DMT)-like permease
MNAKIALALATVYLVWGSTYLGIRWVVAELPPFLAGALRFTVAGAGFLLMARATAGPLRLTRRQLASAVAIGACLPGVSNALVNLAERSVPSALTALILAVTPLWLALLQSARRQEGGPGRRAVGGLLVGFAGTVVLIWRSPGDAAVSLGAMVMLLFASLLWAGGSLYARTADRPDPWMASAGIEMLAGGLLQGLVGVAQGDVARLAASHPSARALGALVYLTVVGAWAGYGAFSWLTRNARPTLVATYAYVNPLVAVLLGWALGGEPITARTLVGGAAIVVSVVLVTRASR